MVNTWIKGKTFLNNNSFFDIHSQLQKAKTHIPETKIKPPIQLTTYQFDKSINLFLRGF
jgi:hypothetical protein